MVGQYLDFIYLLLHAFSRTDTRVLFVWILEPTQSGFKRGEKENHGEP